MKKKMLLIDDQLIFRASFLSIARKSDFYSYFEVSVAKNGEEALHKIKNENYDVITVDLNMPGMNGWDVLEEMKKISPENFRRATKFIISAEGSGEFVSEKMEKYKIRSWLSKPIDIEELLELIRQDFIDLA